MSGRKSVVDVTPDAEFEANTDEGAPSAVIDEELDALNNMDPLSSEAPADDSAVALLAAARAACSVALCRQRSGAVQPSYDAFSFTIATTIAASTSAEQIFAPAEPAHRVVKHILEDLILRVPHALSPGAGTPSSVSACGAANASTLRQSIASAKLRATRPSYERSVSPRPRKRRFRLRAGEWVLPPISLAPPEERGDDATLPGDGGSEETTARAELTVTATLESLLANVIADPVVSGEQNVDDSLL